MTQLTRRSKYPTNDATQANKKLPERLMTFTDMNPERRQIILHKDSRHTMAALRMTDCPILKNHEQQYNKIQYNAKHLECAIIHFKEEINGALNGH